MLSIFDFMLSSATETCELWLAAADVIGESYPDVSLSPVRPYTVDNRENLSYFAKESRLEKKQRSETWLFCLCILPPNGNGDVI